MALSNKDLYSLLQELNVIDEKALKSAYKLAEESKSSLYKVILEKDLANDNQLGGVIADHLGVKYLSLSDRYIERKILKIIPEALARKQQVIAFDLNNKGLHVAMSDPTNIQTKQFLEKKIKQTVIPYFATEKEIENIIFQYSEDTKTTFDTIINEYISQAKGSKENDPPIIKIVNTILEHAYGNNASDIHLEAYDKYSLLRFRVDGVLQDIVKFPINLHPSIVTRIKVLSELRTDEHNAPQDGKIRHKLKHGNLDLRVSIVPVTDGEKVVMRLLSDKAKMYTLSDLGLSGNDLDKVNKAYKKPYGLILSTGPTGSGKTTSMYSVLKILNERAVNIMTIENPVEYDIDGVSQIQVNEKTGLGFSAGLRSIVRQDPDIILVGEIRDSETADIAINSAMTGHLVLSTLHTNDATTTIPRLLDLGVEPFLVASTVNIVIAQRLVRKIHSGCKVSFETPLEELTEHFGKTKVKNIFGDKKKIRTYKGKGCEADHGTGYDGRLGIFEVLIVDDEIRQAIIERKDASVIRKLAVKNGMTTMMDDGLQKVKQGLTTLDEVLRMTKT